MTAEAPGNTILGTISRVIRGQVRAATKSQGGVLGWLFYAAIRSVFAVMQMFPLEWNLRTARLIARAWPHIMARHRNRAIEHLTIALGDRCTPDELERLADRSLESIAMFAVEAVCLPRLITPFSWNRYIELGNFDEGLEAILEGKGAILVTGHYGSFELLGHLLAVLGLDVLAIMRPLDNVYLNRFLVRSRQACGLELLDKKGAAAKAEDHIRAGRMLAFVGDQDAGRKGIFVDFFRRRASTYKSIGLLAMTTNCPIIVGYARRHANKARYTIGVQRVIRPEEWADQDDPLRWITQAYTSAIEDFVRDDPGQYLWIHRRWKSLPRRAKA